MNAELKRLAETTVLAPAQVAAGTQQIRASVLDQSQLDQPNFTTIHPTDLELLLAQYDGLFFGRQLREVLGSTPLHFRLSRRMTSAGGKTTRFRDRATGRESYEISVSTAILFGCFRGDDHRPITVSGIVCRDRLDALQRVMEHELAHLVEMLLWKRSSCAQPRFQAMTRRLFGHTDYRHQLITPRERALAQFGIQPGMRVRFRFDGAVRTGLVNRIHKRATVLVEDPRGTRYSDGKRYACYYVPVPLLEAVDDAARGGPG